MDYQELLRKYITERQESEQKLVGGEVIELTLFASWLNKNAAQQSVHADPPSACEDCGSVDEHIHYANCPLANTAGM